MGAWGDWWARHWASRKRWLAFEIAGYWKCHITASSINQLVSKQPCEEFDGRSFCLQLTVLSLRGGCCRVYVPLKSKFRSRKNAGFFARESGVAGSDMAMTFGTWMVNLKVTDECSPTRFTNRREKACASTWNGKAMGHRSLGGDGPITLHQLNDI